MASEADCGGSTVLEALSVASPHFTGCLLRAANGSHLSCFSQIVLLIPPSAAE